MKQKQRVVVFEGDSVQIDGVEYAPVNTKKKIDVPEYVPFDKKERLAIFKALSNMLPQPTTPTDVSDALSIEKLGVIDVCCVMQVIAKSPRAKAELAQFADREVANKPFDVLQYEKQEEGSSSINLNYMIVALKFFDIFDERVRLRVVKDYPLLLSTDDFDIVIAPRVNNEC
jgi:hypothetical protein